MERSEPVKYTTQPINDNVLGEHSRSSPHPTPPRVDKCIIDSFYSMGLPCIADTQTWLKFDQLSECISQPDTISSACDILDTFLSTKSPKQRHRRARIFLTAYMILMCPNAVLQDTPDVQRKVKYRLSPN